jgi:hypothetical protein
MKEKFLFFSIYLFCLFFNLTNEEDKFIEYTITLNSSAFININIGGQENKPFLISLSSPTIIAFPPVENNTNKYNKELGSFKSSNITSQIVDPNTQDVNLKFNIGQEKIKINKIENSFNIGIIEDTEFQFSPEIAGYFGLSRGSENIENFNSDKLFLDQLIKKNLISQKIIYISNYYKNNRLLNNSKLMIGKFPEEINGEEVYKENLAFCSFEETNSSNFYDCSISKFFIDDYVIELDDSDYIIGRFEEGDLRPNSFPKKLYENFANYFNEIEGCKAENYSIKCTNLEYTQNVSISIVMNDYKFILTPASAWENDGTLSFIFNRDDDICVLTSKFLGNYHRIYDVENNEVFFDLVDDNIIDIFVRDPEVSKTFMVIVIILTVVSIIIIILAFYLFRAKVNESDKTDDKDDSSKKEDNRIARESLLDSNED